MIKYELVYTKEFLDDLKFLTLSGQKQLVQKVYSLLDELEEHPKTGTGKPEQLKGYSDQDVFSRRINSKHRLTYKVFDNEGKVKLLSARNHYSDK